MYQIGDMVLYSVHGACRIIDIEEKKVGKKKVSYFVLEPTENPGARFYVPKDNQVALSKLRHVLTEDQIQELLHSEEVRQDVWIENEALRKERYHELLIGDDRGALLSMIRAAYLHKQDQKAAGKKFHVCDESFLQSAQKLLESEISASLQISPAQVPTFLKLQLLDRDLSE